MTTGGADASGSTAAPRGRVAIRFLTIVVALVLAEALSGWLWSARGGPLLILGNVALWGLTGLAALAGASEFGKAGARATGPIAARIALTSVVLLLGVPATMVAAGSMTDGLGLSLPTVAAVALWSQCAFAIVAVSLAATREERRRVRAAARSAAPA